MKLKLIASVLVLVVALTGVLGATMAYFSDTVNAKATFAAGTLKTRVDGDEIASAKATISNIKPGDEKSAGLYFLENIGSIDGEIFINNITISDQQDGYDLQELLTLELRIGSKSIFKGNLLQLHNYAFGENYKTGVIVQAGKYTDISLIVSWNPTANDNVAQGQSLSVTADIGLIQVSSESYDIIKSTSAFGDGAGRITIDFALDKSIDVAQNKPANVIVRYGYKDSTGNFIESLRNDGTTLVKNKTWSSFLVLATDDNVRYCKGAVPDARYPSTSDIIPADTNIRTTVYPKANNYGWYSNLTADNTWVKLEIIDDFNNIYTKLVQVTTYTPYVGE